MGSRSVRSDAAPSSYPETGDRNQATRLESPSPGYPPLDRSHAKESSVSESQTPERPDAAPPDVPEPAPSPDPAPSPQPPPGTPNPGPGGADEHPLEAEYPDADGADVQPG